MIGREDIGIQILHSNHVSINFTYNTLYTCIYVMLCPSIRNLPFTNDVITLLLVHLNSIYNLRVTRSS